MNIIVDFVVAIMIMINVVYPGFCCGTVMDGATVTILKYPRMSSTGIWLLTKPRRHVALGKL